MSKRGDLVHYTREDGCRAWLTYGMLSADVLNEILEEFGTAEAVYDRFISGGGAFLANRISEYAVTQLAEHAQRNKMHEMMLAMQRQEIGVLGMKDDEYPESLRNIQSPPALLFYRGNPGCLLGKCIAVVGSRKASTQGVEMTQKICRDLSAAGATIVSGFAIGIDTAAHEGCLDGGSPTAAVLGCGLDVDYPAENANLRTKIIREGGVLLSEYPPGIRANKYVFQARNRIISGLGRALLMMESRIQSGSMLTVQHALDQGKEVYAYPGLPGTEWAEGAHQLLREGANYFTSAEDILEDLGWDKPSKPSVAARPAELPPMSEEQRIVFRLLGQGELSFDQLADKTGLSPSAISTALTMLQMMGLIKALPGKCYSKI